MTEVRRGTILTFDAATWTALVLLDGADAEAQMQVGVWVQSQMMVAGLEVACLVFGGTNTDDGVVLGPYGVLGLQDLHTTADPTFDALNIGAASGASSGQVRIGVTNLLDGTVIESGGAGYQAIAVRSTDGGGVRLFLAANAASEARVGTASNHPLHLYVNLGASAILSASGALNLNNAAGKLSVNGTQVLSARKTGWAAATATLSRTAVANADTLATTVSHLAALITDLIAHGVIGA